MKIERALISVSHKSGILEFDRELAARGLDIISTGGTAKLLALLESDAYRKSKRSR